MKAEYSVDPKIEPLGYSLARRTDAASAVHNAITLEFVARMALNTMMLRPDAPGVSQALLDRHYFRKHGAGATYGQKS